MELYLHSPNTPSWRGAQLKAQGQLYIYFYLLRGMDVMTFHTTTKIVELFSQF
jgi:hypothetical protein